jgi:hypothetical protein
MKKGSWAIRNNDGTTLLIVTGYNTTHSIWHFQRPYLYPRSPMKMSGENKRPV